MEYRNFLRWASNSGRGYATPSHVLQPSRGKAASTTFPDLVTGSFWGMHEGLWGFFLILI